MQLRGVDVSHYQGVIDWFAVERGELSFAFAKATEGTSGVDPSFATNWRAIREAGLFRGAYHFGRPGSDPDAQAVHFASIVGELGFRDVPPVLDLEEADGHSADHVVEWARAFTERAELLFQRRLLLYTGGFWRFQLGNRLDPFLAERALWLAAYQKNPVVPANWKAWTFWQYSDGRYNGPVDVPGVKGPVDQNLFAGDAAGLASFCENAAVDVAPPTPRTTPPAAWPGQYFVWPHTPTIAGESVKAWQARVSELGFAIDIDGIYGPQSKSACRAFQRDRGLVADGIVGRKTWDACFAG